MPATPSVRPAPTHSVRSSLDELRKLVKHNGDRARRIILWRGMAMATAIILGTFLAALGADQVLHFPQTGRIVVFGILAVSLLILMVVVVWRWRRVAFTEDGIALAIEDRSTHLDNRLINALQLAREERGSNLSEAVIRENYLRLKKLDVKRSASMKPVLIGVAIVALICLAGAGLWWKEGNRFMNSAARILMPMANLNPLYRTVLSIEPGDTQSDRGSDVKLLIKMTGDIPSEVTVAFSSGGKNDTETLPVAAGATEIAYVFKQVQDDTRYSVRGGDFRSPTYTIKVPAPPALRSVRMEITPPAYTKAKPQLAESSSGHLEGLTGSTGVLHFQLDRPVEKAVLIVERPTESGPAKTDRIELKASSPTEFQGELVFENTTGYHLEMTKGEQTLETPSYGLRLLADQPPQLKLEGLEDGAQAELDRTLPLTLSAEDDYGVARTALAFRKVSATSEAWSHIQEWPVDGKAKWKLPYPLDLTTLALAEGDKIEVALLAQDIDPAKKDQWTESEVRSLTIGGEGAEMQLLYDQILKSEEALRQLATQQKGLGAGATEWIRKLESASGLRWDDQKNIDALKVAVTQLAAQQEATRKLAGEVARAMPEVSAQLRLPVGMLADTDMVNATLALESAPKQDQAQSMRNALVDGQMTQDRAAKSLQDILQQYIQFREEWENDNMTPFVNMLATRQAAMTQESVKLPKDNLDATSLDHLARSSANRQTRLEATTALAQKAMVGVAARVTKADAKLASVFTESAKAMGDNGVKTQMQQAVTLLGTKDWAGAAIEQKKAADTLQQIYVNLKVAAAEAARHAIEQEEAKSELAGEAENEKLRVGQDGNVADSGTSVTSIVKMEETRESGEDASGKAEQDQTQLLLDAQMKASLAELGNAGGARPEITSLATKPSAPTRRSPGFSDLPPNSITAPPIPSEILDKVGDLLKEADEISKEYDTLNANSALTAIDPGELKKSGGRVNSNAAVAKTGNIKPPPTDSGGISGSGRQGARSHGQVAEDTTTNRRGRDEAQEGQEETALQEGKAMTEIMSDDPQLDSSSGIGGKKVDSLDKSWNEKNAGEWKDSWASKMDAPQAIAKVVDHQGAPMDPKVAELLQDMNSRQEQIIQRVKAIRKDLNRLFLPTDKLDDLLSRLQINFDKMKGSPDPTLFRQQQEALNQLRGEMQVVSGAYSGFNPSLPRNRQIKGEALDEPASRPLPGYEDAVKKYYETLSTL